MLSYDLPRIKYPTDDEGFFSWWELHGTSFLFRRTLTIDPTKCGASDSANFTVLVSLSSPTLRDIAHGGHVYYPSGSDIIFTSDAAGLNLLKWEVEKYDNVNGELVAWVRIASVSHLVDTVFYMFYGDKTLTTFQGGVVGAAWDANYLGIYHLNGASPSFASSTGSNNGTGQGNGGTKPTATASKIDGGAFLDDTRNQYVNLGTGMNPTAITMEAWVKADSPPANSFIVGRRPPGSASYFLVTIGPGANLTIFYTDAGGEVKTGSQVILLNIWYHIVVTYDSVAGLKMYINAVIDGTHAANGLLTTTAAATEIGGDTNAASPTFWNGILDEVRISNIARAADWILTEYNNQFSPGVFMTMGAEIRIV